MLSIKHKSESGDVTVDDKNQNNPPPSMEKIADLVVREVMKRLGSAPGESLSKHPRDESGLSILWVFERPAVHFEALESLWVRFHGLGYPQRFIVCKDVFQHLKSRLSFVSSDSILVMDDRNDGGDSDFYSGSGSDSECGSIGWMGGEKKAGALGWCADASVIYVASLSLIMAKRTALLDDSSIYSMLLIDALLAGTPVHVFRSEKMTGMHKLQASGKGAGRSSGSSSVGNSGQSSGALFRRVEGIWRDLEQMGVQALAPEDGLKPVTSVEAGLSPLGKSLGGLVTERDIEEFAQSGLSSLTIAPGTVVTPLAKDRARELGVALVE